MKLHSLTRRARGGLAGAAMLVMAGPLVAGSAVLNAQAGPPETVMITFQAKAGAEAALRQAIADHWTTGRRLGLILAAPHLTVRGTDQDGRTYFVDVFSWRDGDAPDNAPAAIQAIWQRMNGLVEARNGRPGMRIAMVSIVR